MSTLKSIEAPSSAPATDADASSRIVALNHDAVAKLTKSIGPVVGPIVAISLAGLASLQLNPTVEKMVATVAIVALTICGIIYVRQKNLQ